MRYLKLFESFEDIDEICKKYVIIDYTINPDGSIDVDDIINLFNKQLIKLPLKFNKVNSSFACNYNKLTSLEGSPVEVNGNFWCNDNKLASFEFAPIILKHLNIFLVLLKEVFIVMIIQYIKYGNCLEILLK